MSIYLDKHGIIDHVAHRMYIDAMNTEDAQLERVMTFIAARIDAGDISVYEAVIERVNALESHLDQCQRWRREYLGGS